MEIVEDGDAMEVAAAAEESAWPGSARRSHLLQFLLHASNRLDLRPIVKYSALAFFAERLLPALPRKMGFCGARSGRAVRSWLLEPLRDSNLELFALVAVWIASKVHEMRPLSVRSLKALSDRIIADQHFTCRDFADAELVFMEVVDYNIGSSNIAFIYLEELLIQFRVISKLGDLLNMDVCMEIWMFFMRLKIPYGSLTLPVHLLLQLLLLHMLCQCPKQTWEFPILPWVQFTTSYAEEGIMKIVLTILMHVLKPDGIKEKNKERFQYLRLISSR